MAYIASLQKEVLSINNLFREHLKSFGFYETKSPAQYVGLFMSLACVIAVLSHFRL